MPLTSRQRQFLASDPIAAAAAGDAAAYGRTGGIESPAATPGELRERAGCPATPDFSRKTASSWRSVRQRRSGSWAQLVEMHYRNDNFRIAVTAEFLNRLMPKREPEYAPVRDTIQGVPVRGQSLMANEITVRMVPDPQRVRLALEINGEVASLTHSTAGPATFYSDNESSYVARKPLEITLRGIRHGSDGSRRGQQLAIAGRCHRLRRVRRSSARLCAMWPASSTTRRRRPPTRKFAKRSPPRRRSGSIARRHEQIAAAAKRLNDELLGPMDSLLLGPDDDRRGDDREAFQHADSSGRSRSAWRPHAASPGPGRQPGERADPREHAQQRAGAAGVGRPDLRSGRAWPAACRAAPSLPAQAGRSGPGRREDHASPPRMRSTSAATTAAWRSRWRSPG